MITFLARRACRPLTASMLMHPAAVRRSLHYTPIIHDIPDTSDSFFESIDENRQTLTPLTADSCTRVSKSTSLRRRVKLTPEKRLARFDQLFNFVSERLGYRPAVKTPQVRKSAWIHLFGLATTSQQLEKVIELFPRWRDSRREFDAHHAEMFVRRCEELNCPSLALRVFGDHSKYGFPLSLPAAQHLLHSLHVKHPLQDTVAAAALFSAHNLPDVNADLISCSMLASACFKHNTKDSIRVANTLVPHLQAMLQDAQPQPVSPIPKARALDKPRIWLMQTLAKIEKALEHRNEEFEWLRVWRRRSGHVPG